MTTAARPTSEQSCHWYTKTGEACYEVPRASGEGMRATTLADARKLGLLPSVTTILQVLAKPQLTTWLVEQAVLAAMTTPRLPNEPLDAFVERVLHTEKVQDQESDIAKKRGTEIHDAIEGWALGCPTAESMRPWIVPVLEFLKDFGRVAGVESILVSVDGYAGRTDLIQERLGGFHIWDFKTTKKLPTKGSWSEHILQASAYARAYSERFKGPLSVQPSVTTGNIYISTVEPGKFVVFAHDDYWETYEQGFRPLLNHWQWASNYHPCKPFRRPTSDFR